MECSNRKGDFAEYYAVTWLWDQGYEVFKNCGSTGMIDMIAMKDGDIKLIDVKTVGVGGGKGLSEKQKELGVCLVRFNAETRNLAFRRHKHETY
jgi:Holliday junction resolvase-like predicted endonuclease|tara:strand:- start:3547 stop:3828 length:282 start_codon:yes stop_codon:yes gene_type:complete